MCLFSVGVRVNVCVFLKMPCCVWEKVCACMCVFVAVRECEYVCVCMYVYCVCVCVCVSVFIDGRRETSRKFSDQQKQQQTLPRQLNKSARESEMSGSKPANCHRARTIVFHFASLSRQASLSRGMLFNFPFD